MCCFLCASVYIYACIVYMCVCVCVYTLTYIRIYAYVHIHSYTRVQGVPKNEYTLKIIVNVVFN